MGEEIRRVIHLTPWSRGNGNFCFGLGVVNARHIAEELGNIGQSSITVMSKLSRDNPPELMTKCNINPTTFTTTCPHIGNADIAAFIEEYGKEQYGAVLIVDDEGLTIRIDNRNVTSKS